MNTDKMQMVRAEIRVVAEKHKITHWAFCGEEKGKSFVAFMEGPKTTQGAAMHTIINVGRLWQYARQSCRALLDCYERLP